MRRLRTVFLGAMMVVPIAMMAQRQQGRTQAPPAVAQDTVRPAQRPQQAQKPGPKPYREVVTPKAVTTKGMIKVHFQDNRYLFELHDTIINRDILVVNRISKSAAGSRQSTFGYAGDQIGDNVIKFTKGPEDKIFLHTISYSEIGSDTSADGMYRSVLNSNLQPIVASFEIKAFTPDSTGVVIDVTDYLKGDNEVLFFSSSRKRALNLGALQADRSFIQSVKSFPMNVEIKTVKTYARTPAQGAAASPFGGGASTSPLTYELNSSMVLLPSNPMRPRQFDPRVGYFVASYVDFDANPQGVKRISNITRWRLEPKDEDVEKYLRGELVEPKKQIVFYIDPATPKKWVPYLIQGINDWQVAFEQAGFKNAIVGKEAPQSPEWSLEDARHSAIVYKPSDIANASGPHVHDPRTGEILESHINWYHNVMSLLRNWYFIQTAAVDERARKMIFDDELMGQLIRFVSSHEVGHTLGLRHNFGSSSTVPVEKLRDKNFVEQYGHTPSIMDYARFNYVAQPEDGITEKGLFPRIGDYDKWAIEWGYRWYPPSWTPEQEKAHLNKLIIDSLKANPRLYFGTETDPNDPRNQNEDLGDNSMKASAYGIKNLQRIVPNLKEWTKTENEGYDNLRTMYNEVVSQFNRYMGHVAKNIAGIKTTPRTVEEGGVVVEYVSKAQQKEALQFLQDQLFKTPTWLLNKEIYSLTGVGNMNTIATVQENILGRLISANTLNKMIQHEELEPNAAYTANDFLKDLKNGIWSELPGRKATDIYRRNLQKMYAERLIALINPAPAPAAQATATAGRGMGTPATISKTNDALSVIKGHARSLAAEIKAAIPAVSHQATKMHLQDVYDRLMNALDPK
jgi:hypothetical protein